MNAGSCDDIPIGRISQPATHSGDLTGDLTGNLDADGVYALGIAHRRVGTLPGKQPRGQRYLSEIEARQRTSRGNLRCDFEARRWKVGHWHHPLSTPKVALVGVRQKVEIIPPEMERRKPFFMHPRCVTNG